MVLVQWWLLSLSALKIQDDEIALKLYSQTGVNSNSNMRILLLKVLTAAKDQYHEGVSQLSFFLTNTGFTSLGVSAP